MTTASTKVKTLKFVTFLAVAAIAGGCAATAEQAPTHYWDAADAKTQRDYRSDDAQCATSNGAESQGEMSLSSDSFQAYRDCMIGRGYVLRTY